MSQPSPPSPPDPAQTYASGLKTFLQYLPKMLNQEYRYRGKYDPKFIEQQQDLQDKYGQKQYEQQLTALDQINPYFRQVYSALGNNVLGQLDPNNPYVASANRLALQTGNEAALGTKLDPAFQQQLQTEIRAAQAARGGSAYGNAPISGETLYQGRAAQDLYSQRLQRAAQMGQYAAGQRQVPISNAGQFLGTTSPIQQVAQVSPVSAPDQFRIVNPNAGYLGQQIGQQGYQNALAAYSMGNQGGGWMGALTGALGGAAQGGMYGGYYGAAAGAIGGGISGYFSDYRLKKNIVYTGETTRDGIPKVEFEYLNDPTRRRGVIAQDVLKVRPDAVFSVRGKLGVWYDKLGIELETV